MLSDILHGTAALIIDYAALLLLLLLLTLIGVIIYMYIVDVRQTRHAIRRNYPVIGRFRYWFEHLGEFFRQYFFAMDREELPFNRAQRSWVYQAAKNIDTTTAFGSTRPLNQAGDIVFLNALFPKLKHEFKNAEPVRFGEGYAREPYAAASVFNISAMSFGSLSSVAVRALSNGAKQAGIWMNTGEGGLSPYHLSGGCDIVFQIGTAKYGVRDEEGNLSDDKLQEIAAHQEVKMIELKLAQGAKPGKGGILPAEKVTAEIAAIRGIPEGKASLSPNGHTDIESLEQLLDKIHHIRSVSGLPVGFKTVIGQSHWLRELCELIQAKGLDYAPDFITIDSGDGGTGAAPQSLIDFMGLPIKRSLPIVVNTLLEYGLRERIRVITSGKLINPANVAWALCVGADVVVSARGFMFSLGCIQALQCNKNTCPTGITTHDPDLQEGLDPHNKANRVAHFAKNMLKELDVIAHSCGVENVRHLNRSHAQIINEHGLPEPMELVFPEATPKSEYQK
ncbi:FMN-binding glutamate synthase family protein [Pseudoteredinibacter isoporae]|uniref:Glutamate synthase domain-containing protein 2 n=1 Tax=Pseudoteredinibacter isoporae TaxID=570281 RepID=A0A7X0JW66_9GAMM|nr:FMN-binding glutamate synthase family protein [Pseudoteredinibacter isoporae]MBB6522914.1 glutamate synthase domain-containing protein 2 [Pseudoteredinibacter isoporae]NHO88440.1 FMN-binding glutamate synthase family protein [Pseudoteredinibacter isoporae]NIB23229.1 FMN-binding glutamate synthase family protein [Pseudoteredinibacter isoporae]